MTVKVEGFDDFVNHALKEYDASKIKKVQYKSKIPFEIMNRI